MRKRAQTRRAARELILTLAQDPGVVMSESVIRSSPLLGAEDLPVLLATTPSFTTLHAMAERAGINRPCLASWFRPNRASRSMHRGSTVGSNSTMRRWTR
jgi:hypothetical protein